MKLSEKVNAVTNFYAQLNADLANLQVKSGLSCLSGCSNCCKSPNVEATILELLPFAYHLYQENKAEFFYNELINNPQTNVCMLYKPALTPLNNGGCSDYTYRAMICRLFGFSFRRGKENKPEMVTCKEIKTAYPTAYQVLSQQAEAGMLVPQISYYHSKLSVIDYSLSQELYPINKAIQLALEIVLNHFYYTESCKSLEM